MKNKSDILKDLPFIQERAKRIPKVLKSASVKGDKKIIGGDLKKEREVKIDPIYDGDEIVGIKFICGCGNEAEVYFEYK